MCVKSDNLLPPAPLLQQARAGSRLPRTSTQRAPLCHRRKRQRLAHPEARDGLGPVICGALDLAARHAHCAAEIL